MALNLQRCNGLLRVRSCSRWLAVNQRLTIPNPARGDVPLLVTRKGINPSSTNANTTQCIHEAEHVKKPHHDGDDNHHVQDVLNLAIHRNVVVDQPKQNSDTINVMMSEIRDIAYPRS
jgi:hypothetical protein